MNRPLALLIEDEPLLRSEASSLLSHAGIRVHMVREARALGELIDRGHDGGVRLVVMSAEFASFSGADWLAEMSRRKAWSWIPTIATTLTPDSVFACALRGVNVPVLAKPFDAGALTRALDQLE